jgi:hypothetical protein
MAAESVERRARAYTEALARYRESGSPRAAEQLEAAEESLYIARWELAHANRALARAERWRWLPDRISWRSAR